MNVLNLKNTNYIFQSPLYETDRFSGRKAFYMGNLVRIKSLGGLEEVDLELLLALCIQEDRSCDLGVRKLKLAGSCRNTEFRVMAAAGQPSHLVTRVGPLQQLLNILCLCSPCKSAAGRLLTSHFTVLHRRPSYWRMLFALQIPTVRKNLQNAVFLSLPAPDAPEGMYRGVLSTTSLIQNT
jgi:hypothetical protein